MTDRPRFFDDLASVAGGAFSAFAGLRDEAEALARNQTDEMIRRLDLVRKSELDAVQELAANARAGQEAAESRHRRAGGADRGSGSALEPHRAATGGAGWRADDLTGRRPAITLACVRDQRATAL